MFSVCAHLWGGGGGGTLARSSQVGGGTSARSSQPGYPPPPSQVRTGGTQVGGVPGVPSNQVRMGVPRWGVPRVHPLGTGQHMEYLIHHGRYASFVHAVGLV